MAAACAEANRTQAADGVIGIAFAGGRAAARCSRGEVAVGVGGAGVCGGVRGLAGVVPAV